MLAGQIANLAGSWIGRVAGRGFATCKGVEMASSGAAVAIGDAVVVNVVEKRSTFRRKAVKIDLEEDPGVICTALSNDGAAYVGGCAVRQDGFITDASSIGRDDSGILGMDYGEEQAQGGCKEGKVIHVGNHLGCVILDDFCEDQRSNEDERVMADEGK